MKQGSVTHRPFSVYTYGKLEIPFAHYKPPFGTELARLEVADRLQQIADVKFGEKDISKCPGLPVHLFSAEASLKKLFEAVDWMIAKIQAT